ncbi:ABC-F family ATP-binding cassette domain-containing protein [Sphingomicrobium sediminis]|uniref:ATP-binding cassette domain-containing protein n=1 Tax=Sphingomicrobium sediminis TaxID=2950949 RepID=A0A9X2EEW6_9SPHN|nr:ATP-binding cassette domain-containing protein [Sphingomicrobium sediminis]MCM8556267.1 ATP-binding cassette domain-containing protein [Sphingomicrobium sediminis]
MAPPILSLEDVRLHHGDGILFQDLTLHVGPRDRLALIGRNGAGKTTLFRTIMGDVELDAGSRTVMPGINIVWLEQDPDMSGHETLLDWAVGGEKAPPQHAIEAIADQMGIDLDREAKTASGGERRRAALSRALASEPDLLLLDEPTNHLDLGAIEWLEDWLGRYSGAFIVISHDRAFLKRLTTSCIWLDRRTLRRAEIGYGGFDKWTEEVLEEDRRRLEKLDEKLRQETEWLHKGVTARRKRNQGRLRALFELRAQRAAMIGMQGTSALGLAKDDVKTKTAIDADRVTKSYGDRTIIKDFTLRIQRGDRIGIVGANGAGKTTLLRMLTGELEPDEGKVTLAKTLSGIVVDQQRKLLDPKKKVRDILAEGGDWIEVRGNKKHIKGYLKEFLFDPGLSEALIGTLSGGERHRLLLAREFARESNLLVLDEPTNDLDMETLDLLQEVIADYQGTVLLVSHDRDFLDRTVTVTLGLDGSGEVDIVAGGYEDWSRKRKDRRTASKKAKPEAAKQEAPSTKPTKLSYKDQRDFDRLPGEIERLEKEMSEAETALADPDLFTNDPDRFAALTQALEDKRAEKEAAEERWLEVAEKAEGLG